MALQLLDRGVVPVIVERELFPRFHIGESMTGECGALVRGLGFEERMKAAGHPIKHGVTVFGTRGNPDWWVPVMRRDDEGLHDQVTWQVRRSVFDQMVLDEALARGAELVEGRATDPMVDDEGAVVGVVVEMADGSTFRIRSEMTVDCSGQASFLANKKVTGPKYLGSYDKQIAIFTHISDYQRGPGGDERTDQPGNTHIFYTKKYHWAWAIPIDDEVTSIGIVTPAAYFKEQGEAREDYVKREMQELNKGLADRVPEGVMVEPACTASRTTRSRCASSPGPATSASATRTGSSTRSSRSGSTWLSREAARVIDPIVGWLDGKGRGADDPFHDYMVFTERGIDVLEDVLDTFWENPLAFAFLVHSRYRSPLTDVFAGRIYDDMMQDPIFDTALGDFRRLLDRERTYDDEGLYSVPIGSRYHPERAPLWNSNLQDIESTEEWLASAVREAAE